MVRKAEEMLKELRGQMRGGNGTVEIIHMFADDELTGKCRLFTKMTLAPGVSIGLHDHVDEEEVYYLLSGSGVVEEDGVKTQIKAGDAVLTGDGSCHSIENNGAEPLVFMAVIILFN